VTRIGEWDPRAGRHETVEMGAGMVDGGAGGWQREEGRRQVLSDDVAWGRGLACFRFREWSGRGVQAPAWSFAGALGAADKVSRLLA